MFDAARFVADCRGAAAESGAPGVLEVVSRAVETGAIHVYGGNFFSVVHSQWDPERLLEEPYDVDRLLALFEESNRLHPSG